MENNGVKFIGDWVEARFPQTIGKMWNHYNALAKDYPVRKAFNNDYWLFIATLQKAFAKGEIVELSVCRSNEEDTSIYVPGVRRGWGINFPKRPKEGEV